jgi:hypothetical protein
MSAFKLYSRNASPVKNLRTFEVAIEVGDSWQTDGSGDLVTPICLTEEEVDYQIDRLIESLQNVRHAAKAKVGLSGEISKGERTTAH